MNSYTKTISSMTINLRSDGRYEGRLTVNKKRKSFYGTSKSEVKQKAKEYLVKIDNGYRDPKNINLNEYIEYWLETYKFNKIEPSSYDKLERVYKRQIQGTIGKYKIGEITTKDVQALIDSHANPPNAKIKPLARSGLKRILHLLNPCYKKAIEEGIVQYNPCINVLLPIEDAILIKTKEQFALTDSEMGALKNEAVKRYKNGRYRHRNGLVILIMLNTGLRVGEMLALEWKDIDLGNRLLYINKTIQSNVVNRDATINKKTVDRLKKSTKTKAGVRILPLNDVIISYFEELRKYDLQHNISSPYICCTRVGTREVNRNLQRTLDKLQENIDVEGRITLHTLRHSFGSALIRNGVDISVVSQLMGHSNITITYNKYIHVIKEEKAKAMEMVRIC